MELETANKKGAAVSEFYLGRNRRMVPPFCERDFEKYISHFERVAMTLKWPADF